MAGRRNNENPVTEAADEVKSIRKFSNTDEIECVSITPGQLIRQGERSKELYIFADLDDVQWIRYDDLLYMVRSKDPGVFKPRFIIKDADFLEQNPQVAETYGKLYSSADLKAILKLPASQMKAKILLLPPGAQDALKIIVSTGIDNGTFDSIQRIKAIDEIFGTNMLIKSMGKE